jgi:hypothetical protein
MVGYLSHFSEGETGDFRETGFQATTAGLPPLPAQRTAGGEARNF